jgi:hypothetical protein
MGDEEEIKEQKEEVESTNESKKIKLKTSSN